MAVKAVCIVTRSEEGRGAIAVRVDNDENVYFPLSVTEVAAILVAGLVSKPKPTVLI